MHQAPDTLDPHPRRPALHELEAPGARVQLVQVDHGEVERLQPDVVINAKQVGDSLVGNLLRSSDVDLLIKYNHYNPNDFTYFFVFIDVLVFIIDRAFVLIITS